MFLGSSYKSQILPLLEDVDEKSFFSQQSSHAFQLQTTVKTYTKILNGKLRKRSSGMLIRLFCLKIQLKFYFASGEENFGSSMNHLQLIYQTAGNHLSHVIFYGHVYLDIICKTVKRDIFLKNVSKRQQVQYKQKRA